MRNSVTLVLVALAGCHQVAPQSAGQALQDAQKEALAKPIGRFQLAGKREYPNGTEIYVLDTQTGQVCYYFVASGTGGEKDLKTDMRDCAGDPLAP